MRRLPGSPHGSAVVADMSGSLQSMLQRVLLLMSVSYLLFLWLTLLRDSGWPGLHWDSWYFAELVFDIAKNGRWPERFRLATLAYRGEQVAYNHGLIHPLLFGRILQCKTYTDLEIACVWINWVTATSWTMLYWPLRGKETTRRVVWAACVGCCALHISVQLQGRPEHLCMMCALPSILMLRLGCRLKVQAVGLSISTGVMFVVSPIVGMNAGMLIIVLVGAMERKDPREWYVTKTICAMAAVAISVAVLLIWATSPVGVVAWFIDLAHRERTVVDNAHFFLYWFIWLRQTFLGFSVTFPLWNLLYMLMLGIGAWTLLRRRRTKSLVLFLVISAISLRAISDYGIFPLYASCMLAAREKAGKPGRINFAARVVAAGSVYVGTVCAAISLHQAMIVHAGDASRADAIAMIRSSVPRGSIIATHFTNRPSLGFLMDEMGHYVTGFVVASRERNLHADGGSSLDDFWSRPIEFAVLGQTRRGNPPFEVDFDGARFAMVSHNWSTERYQIVGVGLPYWRPGIRFALYRRVSGVMERDQPGRELKTVRTVPHVGRGSSFASVEGLSGEQRRERRFIGEGGSPSWCVP